MTNDMHAAEGSEPTACSGQRVSNTFTGAGARERAARIEMHAAETSGVTACSGRRAHDTLLGSVGRNERAARIEMDAAEGSGPTASCARRLHTSADDVELGSPDADRAPLSPSGSGVTPAAVSSLQTCPAVSDGRRGLFEGAKAKRWTAEEMRVLLDRRLQAHPIPEIAASLGRTPQSVEYKWGLLARRLPASVVARVREQVRHNVGRKRA